MNIFLIVNTKRRPDNEGQILKIVTTLPMHHNGTKLIVLVVTDTILIIISMRMIIFQGNNISCKQNPQLLCKITATKLIFIIIIIIGWKLE